MGQDSATIWDKGIEVPSLSRDNGTTGQAQNLAMGRDGSGQPVKIWDGTRSGMEQSLFFPMISCFTTSFPVIEHTLPVLERPFLVLDVLFLLFWDFWVSDFDPGQRSLSRIFALALVRDKGTAGQGNIFVPGKRDNGTYCPGLSRDVPRDVTSLGNPTYNKN